jgi:hypothetical protein
MIRRLPLILIYPILALTAHAQHVGQTIEQLESSLGRPLYLRVDDGKVYRIYKKDKAEIAVLYSNGGRVQAFTFTRKIGPPLSIKEQRAIVERQPNSVWRQQGPSWKNTVPERSNATFHLPTNTITVKQEEKPQWKK